MQGGECPRSVHSVGFKCSKSLAPWSCVGCVLGGFVLEGGHLLALWHPTEILIIVGAALGAFMTSNPPKISKPAFKQALTSTRVRVTDARTTSRCSS